MSDIDYSDVSRVILRQIRLCNSVSQRTGSGIVQQSQCIELCNLSGVKDTPSLTLSEPSRNGDDHIAHYSALAIGTGDLLDFGEVGSEELCCGEMFLFPEVLHFSSDLSFDIDQLGTNVRLLDLMYLGVRERASTETFERAYCVLDIADFHGLGGFSEKTTFGTK